MRKWHDRTAKRMEIHLTDLIRSETIRYNKDGLDAFHYALSAIAPPLGVSKLLYEYQERALSKLEMASRLSPQILVVIRPA